LTRPLASLQSVDQEAEQAEAAEAQALQERIAAMSSSGGSSSSYTTTTWSDSEDEANSRHSTAWQGKQVCMSVCVLQFVCLP
jgi:hypothetical protein